MAGEEGGATGLAGPGRAGLARDGSPGGEPLERGPEEDGLSGMVRVVNIIRTYLLTDPGVESH